jgi:hypothetical protein
MRRLTPATIRVRPIHAQVRPTYGRFDRTANAISFEATIQMIAKETPVVAGQASGVRRLGKSSLIRMTVGKNALCDVGCDDPVVAISAAIDHVELGFLGVEEEEELVAEQFHLLDSFRRHHRLHRKSLCPHDL